MPDTVFRQRLIAQRHFPDIALTAFLDHQRAAVGVDLGTVEHGGRQRIIRFPRAVRVEAQHRKDRPRVVVARDAVRSGCKILVQKTPRLFLRAPLLAPEVAEQVRIGDVGLVRRVVQPFVEDHLQLLHELPPASHELRQPLHVVRHIERIVPR